jgi:thymidine phosphorylase
VELDLPAIRRVVEREGGCIVWGGAARLSPADDRLIRVERLLDIDSGGQLVASVLSKKAAAGSTHVVIDIPVGPTAKVRDAESARGLSRALESIGRMVGLTVAPLLTDGTQPVGRGIGPALEARDVLSVLRGDADAPRDLKARSLALAGRLLEFSPRIAAGAGLAAAREILEDGRAWKKFQAIAEAQGGLREPPHAPYTRPVVSPRGGVVTAIDNRRLARAAKLAGAPHDPAAGITLNTPVGTRVEAGEPLFIVHAQSPGELAYAMDYVAGQAEIVTVGEGA